MHQTVTETARAKLNLALHVIGRRSDGYHELDSVVAFAEFGDVVTVSVADAPAMTISGPFAADLPASADNIVTTAIDRVSQLFTALGVTVSPFAVHLEKNLPIASGIGGGSADAAAAVRAVIKLMKIDVHKPELQGMLIYLGADVPVCFRQQQCRMQGIGDIIKPIAKPVLGHVLLVNPMIACQTSSVFKKLGLEPGQNHKFGVNLEVPSRWRNDLYEAAIEVVPEIKTVIEELSKIPGASMMRMSGSGATCFAILPTAEAANAAAEQLKTTHPNWWTAVSRLV